MPAISPAKLKRDISELTGVLDQPELFLRELRYLLEYYADRTIRPSQVGMPESLMPIFHIPRPVMRELQIMLTKFSAHNPEAGIELADRLWKLKWYEYCQLAIKLLSALPRNFDDVALARFEEWLFQVDDNELLGALCQVAVTRDLEGTMRLIEGFLESNRKHVQDTGVLAMAAMVGDLESDTLPSLFKLYSQMLENPEWRIGSKMMYLSRILVEKSPSEMAYFLKQQYLVSMRADINRLIRHCLPHFPESNRVEIRNALRENR